MKISKSKTSYPVITLGRGERALWGASTADGRAVDEAKRTVRERAESLIAGGARVVEVYAPASAGGSMVASYEV